VTGAELNSATPEDMTLYWFCKKMDPNNNCGGLEIPCGRTCNGAPGPGPAPAPCGKIPDGCSGDLDWAASTGIKGNPEWYPDFQKITGVSPSDAKADDVQLYWSCHSSTCPATCTGIEAPCGRSCLSTLMDSQDDDSFMATMHGDDDNVEDDNDGDIWGDIEDGDIDDDDIDDDIDDDNDNGGDIDCGEVNVCQEYPENLSVKFACKLQDDGTNALETSVWEGSGCSGTPMMTRLLDMSKGQLCQSTLAQCEMM